MVKVNTKLNIKIPTKEELEGKTQGEIEVILNEKYPEIKAARDAFIGLFNK